MIETRSTLPDPKSALLVRLAGWLDDVMRLHLLFAHSKEVGSLVFVHVANEEQIEDQRHKADQEKSHLKDRTFFQFGDKALVKGGGRR